MKTKCLRDSGWRMALIGAALLIVAAVPQVADNPAEDPVRTVEIVANGGAVKFHARRETQYRNLNPGTQSLASGSYLKTANGTAEIVLPGDSVLSLGPNTEVQVGMYDNGTIIALFSGRAAHLVEPQEGKFYAVWTPLCLFIDQGADFATRVLYADETEVFVEWGHVVAEPYTFDENYHPYPYPTHDVLISEGEKIVNFPPLHLASDPPEGLNKGDYAVYRRGPVPGAAVGRKTPPPADPWMVDTRNLSANYQALRRLRRAKQLTRQEYLTKLIALLQVGYGMELPQILIPPGSLWIGMSKDKLFIIKICVGHDQHVYDLNIADYWVGWDKQTHEQFEHNVGFSIGPFPIFDIDDRGRIQGEYTVPASRDPLWAGATVRLRGYFGATTGKLFVQITSETDVALYYGAATKVDIHLVDPHGCIY